MLLSILKWITDPLRSRKVRTALVGFVCAYIADKGLDLSPILVGGIVGLAAARILGIAIEDAGEKGL